jgi:hypothetical protein
MAIEHIAGVCFCVVFTSAIATAQQPTNTTSQAPAASVTEHTYAAGDGGPWRRVQTRTESGGREVVVETFALPDVEGRLSPVRETVMETMRTSSGSAQSNRDVFGFNLDRKRQLVETTQSREEILAGGDTGIVHDTWVPDLNGRLGLTSREIERTRAAAPDLRQSETTFLVPSLNERLAEIERVVDTERRLSGVVQRDTTHLLRDVNGRWQPTETRRGEIREAGPAERVEEETIQQQDINGNAFIVERTVTRRAHADQQDQVVIENYAPYASLWPRSDRRLVLRERVHLTTTATADGRRTVEEVEGVSLVAPDDPMRVVRRTVATVRQVGPNRWLTERQVFERDVNGRLRLVMESTEEQTGSDPKP